MATARQACFLLLALSVAASADPAPTSAAERLLSGVRAFRSDRYEEALAQFRAIERLNPSEDLAIYLGPTLFKLGRYGEARSVLVRAHRTGGPAADPVGEYYLALTYYRLGLLRLAREVFAGVGAAAGPVLQRGAAQFIASIDAMPSSSPTEIDRLLSRAEADPVDYGIDEAQEALLRAAPGSPQAARAGQVLLHIASRGGASAIARSRIEAVDAANATVGAGALVPSFAPAAAAVGPHRAESPPRVVAGGTSAGSP